MSAKRHVIIGAGTAGINAIRTLRQLGDQGEIHLVSAESPYSRMVLPYYLEQAITEPHTVTASPWDLDRWKVERHVGTRAVSLDSGANTVKLSNDEELAYDNLLIATGSSAARPPIPGADDPGVHTFWTLKDAQGVNGGISDKGHTVVIGAGFITFTILNALISRSKKLTIIESEPRILPRMVDETAAGLVAECLTAQGVELKTGARVSAIEASGAKRVVKLEGGESIKADLVLLATGIRPNLDWLKGSGLNINQGIVVDDSLRSSVGNIYAAGDVAEGKNLITGKKEVHAIEPTAMEHGRVAAANMAGKQVSYPGSFLMNIVGVAGLDVASFGDWQGAGAEAITCHLPDRQVYRKFLFQGDRMTGAILAAPNHETWSENDLGMVKGMIQSGVGLGAWKEYLKDNPFGVKKAYLANKAVGNLLPRTMLGQPSQSPRA